MKIGQKPTVSTPVPTRTDDLRDTTAVRGVGVVDSFKASAAPAHIQPLPPAPAPVRELSDEQKIAAGALVRSFDGFDWSSVNEGSMLAEFLKLQALHSNENYTAQSMINSARSLSRLSSMNDHMADARMYEGFQKIVGSSIQRNDQQLQAELKKGDNADDRKVAGAAVRGEALQYAFGSLGYAAFEANKDAGNVAQAKVQGVVDDAGDAINRLLVQLSDVSGPIVPIAP